MISAGLSGAMDLGDEPGKVAYLLASAVGTAVVVWINVSISHHGS